MSNPEQSTNSLRISDILEWTRALAGRREFVLAFVLLSYLLLVSADLLPSIHDIFPDDEAKYIDSGRSLVGLQLRELAWGPLVSLFYAPLHLIFRNSPDWFLLEAWVGRILQFALLWISTLYLASKIDKHVNQFVVVGVMFVSVGFFFVVRNQSDVLFSSFSVIALAQLISFHESKRIKDVWVGSAALGLAALSRIDALAWLLVYVMISLAIGFRAYSIGRILSASLIPTLAFIAGFVAISWMDTGGFDSSVGSLAPKLYLAFEQNQSVLTGGDDEAAVRQSRELFGTKDDNEGSVFKAILNNPSQFTTRILANIRNTPSLYLSAFDKRVGVGILMFAILGVVALARKRAYSLLMITLLWALPSTYYLGFLSRHVVSTTAYLPIVFASVGISYGFRKDVPRSELSAYVLLGLVLVAYSWIEDKPAFLATGLVLTIIFILMRLLWPRMAKTSKGSMVAFFLLRVGAIILRDDFAFPNYRKLGDSADERAIHFLQDALPLGSKVAVPTPNLAIAAAMVDFPIEEVPSFKSSEGLHLWLSEEEVRAVYVHLAYLGAGSQIRAVLQNGLGSYFDMGLSEGNSEIFVIRDIAADD